MNSEICIYNEVKNIRYVIGRCESEWSKNYQHDIQNKINWVPLLAWQASNQIHAMTTKLTGFKNIDELSREA